MIRSFQRVRRQQEPVVGSPQTSAASRHGRNYNNDISINNFRKNQVRSHSRVDKKPGVGGWLLFGKLINQGVPCFFAFLSSNVVKKLLGIHEVPPTSSLHLTLMRRLHFLFHYLFITVYVTIFYSLLIYT